MLFFFTFVDFLCSNACIIDAENKPSGVDLPIEVQNRIMWMVMLADHTEKVAQVHEQLKRRATCRLTDWLRVPKTPERFHAPWKHNCPCEKCNPHPLCHWCQLYGRDHASVKFKVMENKLERIRESVDLYDNERYEQFVRNNLPTFRDVLQFTATVVLLPMLCHLSAGRYQFNAKSRVSPTASFASMSLGHMLFVEGLISQTNATEFRNPREVREERRAADQRRWTLTMLKKNNNNAQ